MTSENSAGFFEAVNAWVESAVRGGAVSFGQLLRSLPGVYPSVARDALRRLAGQGALAADIVDRMLSTTSSESIRPKGKPQVSILPVPHPLDYEWRYADAATDRLLRAWDESPVSPGPLVLLGAPSVVQRAVRQKPRRKVVALDMNSAVVAALRNACPRAHVELCDLGRDELPRIPKAAAVVSDPPWYPEHLDSFLWAACRLCRPGAKVLVSLPPLGTRPGIEKERDLFMELGKRMGLELLGLDYGALPYVSPLFEVNALRAEGLADIPLDWRRGDLAEFVWTGKDPGPRPPAPPSEETWIEVAVSGARFRVRHRAPSGFEDPSLVPIIPGNVLPTVSRRDPRRRGAEVWTAGNRVFGCRGPGILAQILRALATGHRPVDRVGAALARDLSSAEAELVRHASEQASEVVHAEKDEQESWEERCRRERLAIAV